MKVDELFSEQNRRGIRFGRFASSTKRVQLESKTYGDRSILAIVDGILDRFDALNGVESFIDPIRQRSDFYFFDMDSVREIFLNVVGHNDYDVDTPCVYMFPDRLEIISYGGLPKGQTMQGFIAGRSIRRNPMLAEVFMRLHYVEQNGHGMETILANYPPSIFEVADDHVKASVPIRRLDKESMSGLPKTEVKRRGKPPIDDAKLVDYLERNPQARLDELADELSLSRRQAQRYLSRSTRIRHVGPTRGGYWEVID